MNFLLNLENKIKNLKKKKFSVSKLILKKTKKWYFEDEIFHESKKFFKIQGFRIKTNFPYLKSYDQALINQDEIGYLIIFCKRIKKKLFFLLQLKAEPGNKNIIQLSPTIQATKSNYSRIHKGKNVKFLDIFKKNNNVLLNICQPEQGTRYLNKYNRNIILILNRKIKINSNYLWVDKQELFEISKKNNLLNMDTISIFSCFLKKNEYENSLLRLSQIESIYQEFIQSQKMYVKKISLHDMLKWKFTKNAIYDVNKLFFSIFSLNVNTSIREVKNWCQPIISDHRQGLNILLIKRYNDTLHYLVKVVYEPGYSKPFFTSTIIIKNYNKNNYDHQKQNFITKIKNKEKLLDVKNSDEGGRFYHNIMRNLVYNIKDDFNMEFKKDIFIWVSYNQMIDLIKKRRLSIEVRNLFGLLNIDKIYD